MKRVSTSTQRRTRLYLVVAIIAILLLLLGYKVWQTWRHASSLRAHLEQLQSVGRSNPRQIGPGLELVQQDFRDLSRDLRLPLALAPHLGWLPVVGPTIAAAPVLFQAGGTLLDAGVVAWGVAEGPLVGLLEGEGDPLRAIPQIAAQAMAQQAPLRQAAEQARAADASLQTLDAGRLAPQQLASRVAQLQEMTPLLVAALDGVTVLPELVPPAGQRTWLLLAQNNDELRPTGGFISNIGTITLADGLPAIGPLADSYQVENWKQPHADPPDPLRKYMGIDLWVTRDGNWWPDFPTSARAVADLYTQNQGTPVDGVLAVDMAGAGRFLEALTPLKLPGGEQLQPGNAAQTFRDSWSLPPGSLVTSGVVITATQPFTSINVTLHYNQRDGDAWFDSVQIEDLNDPGSNLVRNGSFEEDADGDRLPDGWAVQGLAAGDGLVEDQAHTGVRSLLLVGDQQVEKSIQQQIEVSGKAGARYRITASSRAKGVGSAGGLYALAVILEGADPQGIVATFPSLTHDWATAGTGEILGKWWNHRKDVVNEAMQAAVSKILATPGKVRWLDLLRTMQELLAQRHIQFYAADASVQAFFERQGWAGKLAQPDRDYLLVVDSNVGYNKVSATVEQAIAYEVTLSPQEPRARLTIRYTNPSTTPVEECNKFGQYVPTYETMMQGCYWDYVRVYVPEGARLLSAMGGDEQALVLAELGRAAFAVPFVLRPGESRELSFEYLLPPTVLREGAYRLVVQKQAGTDAIPLTIRISAPDYPLQKVMGLSPDTAGAASALFHTDLSVDRQLDVRLRPRVGR